MSKMPSTATPTWVPTPGVASRAPSVLPSPQPTPRPSYKPTAERFRKPTSHAIAGAVPHHRRRSPQRRRRPLRRRSRRQRPRRCRRRGRRLQPSSEPSSSPSPRESTIRSDPRARARAHINTVATAVVGARPGADVRPDRASFWSTHLKALGRPTRPTTNYPPPGRRPPCRRALLQKYHHHYPYPRPRPSRRPSPTAHGGPDAAGPPLRLRKTETDLLLSSSTVDVTFDLSTDATYDDAFCEVETATLTVGLSGDFNNGTEDGVREEAFLAVNGNSVATDRCTVPTECLDSSGGQAFGFRSAGYETCAPFLDVPVTVQDGVLAATISASASVDGCPAFANARLNARYCCFSPSSMPTPGPTQHRPTRRRKCHPQSRLHYPRCHQQKRRRARHPHMPSPVPFPAPTPAPQTPSSTPSRVPSSAPSQIPTPRPTPKLRRRRVPTTTPSSLPYPAPSPVPSTSFAPTTAGRPSLRPTRMPTPIRRRRPRRPRRRRRA